MFKSCSLWSGAASCGVSFALQIPGRVCYLFWVHILAPWIFDPNQSPQISEKKQKKQERRLKRMQNAGRWVRSLRTIFGLRNAHTQSLGWGAFLFSLPTTGLSVYLFYSWLSCLCLYVVFKLSHPCGKVSWGGGLPARAGCVPSWIKS